MCTLYFTKAVFEYTIYIKVVCVTVHVTTTVTTVIVDAY
jgi:hypothetical protein